MIILGLIVSKNAWLDTEPGEFADPERLRKNLKHQLKQLEQYPRVQQNIATTWGTERGRPVLVGLIVDNRDRPNSKVQGFPAEIYTVLNNLLELHDENFSQYKPRLQPWDIQ